MTKRPRILPVLLCLCLTMAFCAAAFAALPANTVRAGFFAMDGYHMQDERGARSGYGYDFLQLVSRYCDVRFEYLGYESGWAESQALLESGDIDLLTSAQKTPAREAVFSFTERPIGTSAAMLTMRAGNERYSAGEYAGYDKMRVGLISGNSRNDRFAEFAQEKGFSYRPVYYEDMDSLALALQEGKEIDAAVTSNLRQTKNEWILDEFASSPFYAIVRKENTELLKKLNYAIAELDAAQPDWRAELFKKYYNTDSSGRIMLSSGEREYLTSLRKSGKKLKAAVNPDCAPYSYFKDGQAKGIIPDIFAKATQSLELPYEIVPCQTRAEYEALVLSGEIDILLDATESFYAAETNGFKALSAYYTTPLAVLSRKYAKAQVAVAASIAEPVVGFIDEYDFAALYESENTAGYDSLSECVRAVKSGKASGAYMLFYCAQDAVNSDPSGCLRFRVLSDYTRSYAYSVRADADSRLISALDKASRGLSVELTQSIASENTAYIDISSSPLDFFYQNPLLAAAFSFAFAAVLALAIYYAQKSGTEQKELLRARVLERFISYLCESYDHVVELNVEDGNYTQYVKLGRGIQSQSGALRDEASVISAKNVHPDDLESFRALFSLEEIGRFIDTSEGERYFETRLKSSAAEEYRWHYYLLKVIPKDARHPRNAMLLIKDIDNTRREQEQNRETLAAALDAAMAASRSKSTFLSSISHEIRTPLNAIIGYMAIAENSIDSREKALSCINGANVAARHLLSIINDVLDMSSIESGKMKLAHEEFSFKRLVSSLSTLFYSQCSQKGVEFRVYLQTATDERLIGDQLRLNQILINLLGNAVKFTEKGEVSLTIDQSVTSANGLYIMFAVADTGCGMTKETLARVFDAFEQASTATTREYGGNGLGLAIVKNLVDMMGGAITVESEPERGSKFVVDLPFERAEHSADKYGFDISRLRVLVLDDDQATLEYMSIVLTRIGVDFSTQSDCRAAISLLEEARDTGRPYQICIIDWKQPFEVSEKIARRLRERFSAESLAILATAYAATDAADDAKAAGVDMLIEKPVFQSSLMDMLSDISSGRLMVQNDDPSDMDFTGCRVLLAEDNETNRLVETELLQMAGVEVETAENGQAALDMFAKSEENYYSAILMDVRMPVMDGYAATKAIRACPHASAKTVPIIAMTANAFSEDVSKALSCGMNDHVAKPIDYPTLLQTLSRHVKRG